MITSMPIIVCWWWRSQTGLCKHLSSTAVQFIHLTCVADVLPPSKDEWFGIQLSPTTEPGSTPKHHHPLIQLWMATRNHNIKLLRIRKSIRRHDLSIRRHCLPCYHNKRQWMTFEHQLWSVIFSNSHLTISNYWLFLIGISNGSTTKNNINYSWPPLLNGLTTMNQHSVLGLTSTS